MIRDRLIPAVQEAFPDKPFLFSSPPDPIIRLPSGLAEIGDLAIYDDGEEATVCITEITHGHFNPYDASLSQDQVDEKVTEDVLAFLRDLFSDRVLLYRTPYAGHGRLVRIQWRSQRRSPLWRDGSILSGRGLLQREQGMTQTQGERQ